MMNFVIAVVATASFVLVFYLIVFPMKRFVGALCAPLERIQISTHTPHPVFSVSDIERYRNITIRFLYLLFLYMIVSFITSMTLSGSVYLISSSIPNLSTQLPLIRKFTIFGVFLGVSLVSISRISALTYSILPARLILFYVVGIIGALSLYTVVNVSAFTNLIDLAVRLSFYNLPFFIFCISLVVALMTETTVFTLRKQWPVARFVPYQMINEIRESFEEQEYVLGYKEINNLVEQTFKSAMKDGFTGVPPLSLLILPKKEALQLF